MDRNEYNFKIEEMRVAVRNKDYERAVQIADSLDYRREGYWCQERPCDKI